MERLELHNGEQRVTFVATPDGFRPEWFWLGERPMLRFKDHEFLNVGALRVTAAEEVDELGEALLFGGQLTFAGARLAWNLLVAVPDDGGGFLIHAELHALNEPVELLEAMCAFELPYEYDGHEHQMTVIGQQPVFRHEGDRELSGAGYDHPFWYYGRPARAHLTYPTQSPLMACRVHAADGGNERCTLFLGNWQETSIKDVFAQPTRAWREADELDEVPVAGAQPGLRGRKFLIGAANWNTSLHKDPNFLLEPAQPLTQELVVDYADSLPGGSWPHWLGGAWERLLAMHFPEDGEVPAHEVARSRGADWVEAADWLGAQFQRPEGCPGFFYPETGPCVYAPHTRPRWDPGVAGVGGQWVGPLQYLSQLWHDPGLATAGERLEALFVTDQAHPPERIWTIGPTPMYCSMMRKAALTGLGDDALAKVRDYVTRRAEVILNPPAGAKRGDGGILAWEAFANLLAAELFDREGRLAAARALLAQVRERLADRWWGFNCAAEGDLVGAGQGRPFGHGIAATANLLAHQRLADPEGLGYARDCAELMLALYFAAHNDAPSCDVDTRGWAIGANGGRDQWCQMPPWETAHALLQLPPLIAAGVDREAFYDVLWLFAHTGLAMFPKARVMKRLYDHEHRIVYRPSDSLASEREFYQKLPYLAYENPWDQTMLAGYQGVEPLLLSVLLGGGLVRSENHQVLALVPAAAGYDPHVADRFEVLLWNPTPETVRTRLLATVAQRQGRAWSVGGEELAGTVASRDYLVPPREIVRVRCAAR